MRSSRLAILLVGALAGAAMFMLLTSRTSASRPIGLGLQTPAKGSAIVTLTNLRGSKVDYVLKVERKTADTWPKYQQGIPLGADSGQSGSLEPAQVSVLTVPVMVYAPPCPWRVSVFCYRNSPGPTTTRFKVGLWLLKLHMPRLARKAFGESKVVQVSGPQMEQ